MQIGSAMGAGATSTAFLCSEKYVCLDFSGSFQTTTATVEASPDNGVHWFTLYTKDATGTSAPFQVTVTDVPASAPTGATNLPMFSQLAFAHGLRVRVITNTTGTTPSINVWANGTNVGPV